MYDFFGKKVRSLRRDETYTDAIPEDGFAWYILLSGGENGACLGLLDKYVGFTAVENVWQNGNAQTVVLHEIGTVGWIADRAPEKVSVNGADVTGAVHCSGSLCTLDLPVAEGKAVISVVW